jgi:hypothetical protein
MLYVIDTEEINSYKIVTVKVKFSPYRPEQALGDPEG